MPRGKGFKKTYRGLEVNRCTPEIIEKIVQNLRLGTYVETACVMAGVPKQTFYKWIKLSHNPKHEEFKKIYVDLRDAVEIAQEEALTRDLLVIDKCANGIDAEFLKYPEGTIHPDTGENLSGKVVFINGVPQYKRRTQSPEWGASAWRIERRFARQWSKTEKVELTGKNGGPLETSEETAEEKAARKQRVESLLKKRGLLGGR